MTLLTKTDTALALEPRPPAALVDASVGLFWNREEPDQGAAEWDQHVNARAFQEGLLRHADMDRCDIFVEEEAVQPTVADLTRHVNTHGTRFAAVQVNGVRVLSEAFSE